MESAHLSPLELFNHADVVVKSVFILLGVASVWCWGIVVKCTIGMVHLKRTLASGSRGTNNALMQTVIDAGAREAAQIYPREKPLECRGRVAKAMRRRIQELLEKEQSGLGNLAVISSVAPFIGLFGTVWGIMTSFVGIAAAKDTSLAVVAPGIAEALAATAAGLAAAIPAAFAYNRFAFVFNRLGRRFSRLADDKAVAVSAPDATVRS
jgi:biopolymer transport protein ExbB/TolQ